MEHTEPVPTITKEMQDALRKLENIADKRQVYVFTNIRFATPPTGDLRWKKPVPPRPISGIQDGKSGYSCKQILPKRGLNFLGSYNEEPWATSVDELIGATGSALWPYFTTSSEDCLFLDVYVPAKLIKNPSARKVPVMNWIYGGAVSVSWQNWITSHY
jgi:carboxylesterase type B